MRLPNGFGSVVKLSGNRRKPYMARKTEGYNAKKHPIIKIIGYYATREEALIALSQYNSNPWDLELDKVTFRKLYEMWLENKWIKLGKSNQSMLKSAYKYCDKLNLMKFKQIKAYHMQEIIDNCGKGHAMQSMIKNLFYHLDRYALELDVSSNRYSDLLTVDPAPESNKTPFTDGEVDKLWEHQNEPWVDSILTFLYTGFRIGELLSLKNENVDLTERTLKGGSKTRSGKNRIVPIHSKILHIIEKRYDPDSEYLFSYNNKKLTSSQYYRFWDAIMEQFGMDHTPHECRHTLRSRLDSVGANKVCIDLIMGHKSGDVGERIYTHKTIDELKNTIELIKN